MKSNTIIVENENEIGKVHIQKNLKTIGNYNLCLILYLITAIEKLSVTHLFLLTSISKDKG